MSREDPVSRLWVWHILLAASVPLIAAIFSYLVLMGFEAVGWDDPLGYVILINALVFFMASAFLIGRFRINNLNRLDAAFIKNTYREYKLQFTAFWGVSVLSFTSIGLLFDISLALHGKFIISMMPGVAAILPCQLLFLFKSLPNR